MARLYPSLSYRGLPCGPSLVRWMLGVAQPVFRFLPEEIVPCVVVDSVCLWEEVSSGSF